MSRNGDQSKSWTLIFTDVEADDREILGLGELLIERAAEAGYSLRATTVEAWLFRSQRNRESFQDAPKTMDTLPAVRRGKSMGNGPAR